MALEIVDAVRKAESDAEQAEKMVAEQCERVLSTAKVEAQKSADRQEAEAQLQSHSLIENAKCEGNQILKDEQAQTQIEIKRLRDVVSRKEPDVVKLILSEFV